MRRGGGRGPEDGTEADAKVEPESKAEAEARKASAEADKARTDADSAAFSAAFPKGSPKPREGKVEIEGKVGLVSDLIAHAMMRRAGEEIRNDLVALLDKDEHKILLVSSPDLIGSDWPLAAIAPQLAQHKSELEQTRNRLIDLIAVEFAVPEPELEIEPAAVEGDFNAMLVGAGVLGVGNAMQVSASVISSAAEIAALFQADYKINARDVSIGASPLLAAVAHFLIGRAKEVNVEGFSLLKRSRLFQDFTAAVDLRLQVRRLATELKASIVTPLDRRIEWEKEAYEAYSKALVAEKPVGEENLYLLRKRVLELHGAIGEAEDFAAERTGVAVAEGVLRNFDRFATGLLEPPKEGYPPLLAAAIHERLHSETDGYTHVLYAGVEAAGGETITRSTVARTSIRSIGGAQVSYLLWDVEEERLLAADSRPFLATAKLRPGSGFVGGIDAIRIA
jgi:hypothetical protein